MIRSATSTAAAVLLLHTFFLPAHAQNSANAGVGVDSVITQLKQIANEPSGPRALVARRGTFRGTAIFKLQSPASPPFTCQFSVSHLGSMLYIAGRSAAATFDTSSQTGMCDVVVPYEWAKASSSGQLRGSMSITSGGESFPIISQSWDHHRPPPQLPGSNGVTLTFAFGDLVL